MAWPPFPTQYAEGDTPEVKAARVADTMNWLGEIGPIWATYEPFVDALSTLLASVNYAGVWDDLTGSLAAGETVYHEGAIWLALVAIADVTTVEPGTDATKWFTIQRPNKRLEFRTISTDVAAVDLPLPVEWDWFTLNVENAEHDATADRGLAVAFSTDAISGDVVYGAPVAVSAFVATGTEFGTDLTFFRSQVSARGLRSSRLGELGHIVPTAATAIRIGPMAAEGFDGRLTPGAADIRITLIGYKGNAA